MKPWILLVMIITSDHGVVWKAKDKFEFQGACNEASLKVAALHAPTCVYSPHEVVGAGLP